MGLKKCEIILDNPWNSYHPGQTINGTVEYTFDSPKAVRGIYIQFRGLTETSWMGTPVMERKSTDNNVRPKIAYTGDEECFNITYYIMGSKNGGSVEIPAGDHSYPFSCALPPSLPSSFDHELGRVRYTVKTTLDRPLKFDQETEMIFTIVNNLDLNTDPENRKPIHMQMETNFCCFCCKSGPLVLDAHVPISGFCSGQTFPIEISCENGSNVRVQELEVEIRKIMTFRTQFPTSDSKHRTDSIVKLTLIGVNANSSKNWKENLQIPPDPPANLTNCGLIDLRYDLRVNAVTSGCHMNLEESIPITLGTVPVVDFDGPPPSDAIIEGGVQSGAEMPLLATVPGIPYPGAYGQPQLPSEAYGQQQPYSPQAYGHLQSTPEVYGQPQSTPGIYNQPQSSLGGYGQQPPPGVYGQPEPQTQFPLLPGWVVPPTGLTASQQTGIPQNPYMMPANTNITTPGAPPQFPCAPQQ